MDGEPDSPSGEPRPRSPGNGSTSDNPGLCKIQGREQMRGRRPSLTLGEQRGRLRAWFRNRFGFRLVLARRPSAALGFLGGRRRSFFDVLQPGGWSAAALALSCRQTFQPQNCFVYLIALLDELCEDLTDVHHRSIPRFQPSAEETGVARTTCATLFRDRTRGASDDQGRSDRSGLPSRWDANIRRYPSRFLTRETCATPYFTDLTGIYSVETNRPVFATGQNSYSVQ